MNDFWSWLGNIADILGIISAIVTFIIFLLVIREKKKIEALAYQFRLGDTYFG